MLESTHDNYVFGRSPMSSAQAWVSTICDLHYSLILTFDRRVCTGATMRRLVIPDTTNGR